MKGLSRQIDVSPQAEFIAETIHEAYQRRALDQFGYPPRAWSVLSSDEKRLLCEAIQEMLDAGRLMTLPECTHPEEEQARVIREIVVCHRCGTPPRLLARINEGGMA